MAPLLPFELIRTKHRRLAVRLKQFGSGGERTSIRRRLGVFKVVLPEAIYLAYNPHGFRVPGISLGYRGYRCKVHHC